MFGIKGDRYSYLFFFFFFFNLKGKVHPKINSSYRLLNSHVNSKSGEVAKHF